MNSRVQVIDVNLSRSAIHRKDTTLAAVRSQAVLRVVLEEAVQVDTVGVDARARLDGEAPCGGRGGVEGRVVVGCVGGEGSGDGGDGLPVGRLDLDEGDVEGLGAVDVVVVEGVMLGG